MGLAKKHGLLLVGLLETFIFSGSIMGWAAMDYMLKKEGVYSNLCPRIAFNESLSEFNRTEDVEVEKRCHPQESLLNLAYTIGSFCIGFSAFVWGFLLERWGLRTIRLLINGLITTGTVLLSLTGQSSSYFLFPAITLVCFAGIPLRMANMQIANLFPKQRSTVITLYSGAFSASAAVYIFIQYAYDSGLTWEWANTILIVCSVCMLPITLFVLPSDRIEEDKAPKPLFNQFSEIATIYPDWFGRYNTIPESPSQYRKAIEAAAPSLPQPQPIRPISINVSSSQEKVPDPEKPRSVPLKESLFSIPFFLLNFWFSWLLLYTVNYAGSLTLWLTRISGNTQKVAWFIKIYGIAQIGALVLAPLSGLWMDMSLNSAAAEPDDDLRKLKTYRSGFWPLCVTTLTLAIIMTCKLFNREEAVYISVFSVTILRSLLVAVGTAYLRARFPASHFNPLLGIMSTTASVFTLLQFPLFDWEAKAGQYVTPINIFHFLMLALISLHPLHLLISPLQRIFIRHEKEAELMAKTSS